MAQARVVREYANSDCHDQWGNPMPWNDWSRLEWCHIKQSAMAGRKAPNDEAHGVAGCPWHHRLSRPPRLDSTVVLGLVRIYLAACYPAVWGAD